jgi:tagaturonate reductase
MILSRSTLKEVSTENVVVPRDIIFDLPEKVLQFGTGVLLRGLPDYFIDKANKQGVFNGRVVVVKSTAHGDTSAFDRQDGLYTLCVRGFQNNERIEANIINSSISRVLNAQTDWNKVLACARDANIEIVVSNTTEVGIQLTDDDITKQPPSSFPGKLLSYLYERYKAFAGSADQGMIIIPTELIPGNGDTLKSIVVQLAKNNKLEPAFIEWVEKYNRFCNSLVDRIVPGKPDAGVLKELEDTLGYEDGLLTMSEVYRLWAIEGDEYVRNKLSFAQIDQGVIIEPDIQVYRELKLRLLNGTHTLSCGLAFLSGCETVKQAMDDNLVSSYISRLMVEEIATAIPYEIEESRVKKFATDVLDRFRNPHIKHQWINITMQYSSKMKMRCIPVLRRYYDLNLEPPPLMSLGFAAYIYFMKATQESEGNFYGEWNGERYLIRDDMASTFFSRWKESDLSSLVERVLQDKGFWEIDLTLLPGFYDAVFDRLKMMTEIGVRQTVERIST